MLAQPVKIGRTTKAGKQIPCHLGRLTACTESRGDTSGIRLTGFAQQLVPCVLGSVGDVAYNKDE
jgi:hypothetical protein